MINSNSVLYVIYLFGVITLFYTYQNDFNVFLLTLLLMLGAFWCYLYINEVIEKYKNKIDNLEKSVGSKIDFLIGKLFNVKEFTQQQMENSNSQQ